MTERDRTWLEDIVRYGDELLGYMRGVSLESFGNDRRLQLVAERLMEIIGEAAGNLSAEARDAIPFEWRAVRGLRNVIAHQYGRVDVGRLYTLVTQDLPRLLQAIADASEGQSP